MEKLIEKILKNKKQMELTIAIEDAKGRVINTYTAEGKQTSDGLIRYEIGSLTKIFTATLLAKYITNGELALDDSLNIFFDTLGKDSYYPTIKRLATHSSGYKAILPFPPKAYYKMFYEVLTGAKSCVENPFILNSTNKMVATAMREILVEDKEYTFEYANINYSILGLVLEQKTTKKYHDLMTTFIKDELKLQQTSFAKLDTIQGYTSGEKRTGNWQWDTSQAVIASGGLYSTANDLLSFLTLNITEASPYFSFCHKKIAKGTKTYDMALGWKVCKDSETRWHNGGTGCFNSFIGFNKVSGKKVVILANYRSLLIDKLGLELMNAK